MRLVFEKWALTLIIVSEEVLVLHRSTRSSCAVLLQPCVRLKVSFSSSHEPFVVTGDRSSSVCLFVLTWIKCYCCSLLPLFLFEEEERKIYNMVTECAVMSSVVLKHRNQLAFPVPSSQSLWVCWCVFSWIPDIRCVITTGWTYSRFVLQQSSSNVSQFNCEALHVLTTVSGC